MFENLIWKKSTEFASTAMIIYTIKNSRLLDIKHAKPLYILILSPFLLLTSLWNSDTISYQYRKFLLSFTFPECRLDTTQKLVDCKSLHVNEKDCYKALKNNATTTMKKTFLLYWKLYFVEYILTFIIIRKLKFTSFTNEKKNILVPLYSTLCSFLFLGGQTILQRIVICLHKDKNNYLSKKSLFLSSIPASVPVLLERNDKVAQVNNLVASHIIVGALKKYDRENGILKGFVHGKLLPTVALSLFVPMWIYDKTINLSTMFVSIVLAKTF